MDKNSLSIESNHKRSLVLSTEQRMGDKAENEQNPMLTETGRKAP